MPPHHPRASTHDAAEDDGLEPIRSAVLVLADRQTAVLDVLTAQGQRLDAHAAALQRLTAAAEDTTRLLREVVGLLQTTPTDPDVGRLLVDAIDRLAARVPDALQPRAAGRA